MRRSMGTYYTVISVWIWNTTLVKDCKPILPRFQRIRPAVRSPGFMGPLWKSCVASERGGGGGWTNPPPPSEKKKKGMEKQEKSALAGSAGLLSLMSETFGPQQKICASISIFIRIYSALLKGFLWLWDLMLGYLLNSRCCRMRLRCIKMTEIQVRFESGGPTQS